MNHQPGVFAESIQWYDRDTKERGGVNVNEPVAYTRETYLSHNWLGWLTPDDDYLPRCRTELEALNRAAILVRLLHFMDATKLRPSRAGWHYLLGTRDYTSLDQPPGIDHTCVWRGDHKKIVVTTEPYNVEEKTAEMKRWCDDKQWTMAVAPVGQGLWNPPKTTLIVLAPPRGGVDVWRIANYFGKQNR